jgi:hypothetical protein
MADKLPGGLGDKGRPEGATDEQIEKGLKVEREHTDDPKIQREIVYDHLTEDLHYYDKLEKMEAKEASDMTHLAERVARRFQAEGRPQDQAKSTTEKFLGSIREIDFDGYLPGYLNPTMETAKRVGHARKNLENTLAEIWRDVTRGVPIEEPTIKRLEGNYEDAIATWKGHLNALKYWMEWAEGEIGEHEKQKDLVTTLSKVLPEYNEWLKYKSEKKGKTKLGTPIQFEIVEVSKKDLTWTVYITEAQGKTYRIAPDKPGEKNKWRIDKGPMLWESVNSAAYKSPAEAAKALVDILGGPDAVK